MYEEESSSTDSYSTDTSRSSSNLKSSSIEPTEQLLSNAIEAITELLEKSDDIREEFKTQWKSILNSYHQDIFTLEKALEKFPSSLKLLLLQQKKEKEELLRNKHLSVHSNYVSRKDSYLIKSNQHALNFHLQKDRSNSDYQDVFILPPIENNDSKTVVVEKESKFDPVRQHDLDQKAVHEGNETLSGRKIQKDDSKRRFNARIKIFQKMDEMRKNEEYIEQLLFSSYPSLDCKQHQCSGMEIQEGNLTALNRDKMLVELETCTKRNCEEKMKLLESYHSQIVSKKITPLVTRAEAGKMKRLGLNIPCIESMLQEIQSTIDKEEIERNMQDNKCGEMKADTTMLPVPSKLSVEGKDEPMEILKDSVGSTASNSIEMEQKRNMYPLKENPKNQQQYISDSTQRVISDTQHFLNIEDLPRAPPASTSLSLKEFIQNET